MKKRYKINEITNNEYFGVIILQVLESIFIGIFNLAITLIVQRLINSLISGFFDPNIKLFVISMFLSICIVYLINKVKQKRLSTTISNIRHLIYNIILNIDLENLDDDIDILTIYTQNFNNFISFMKYEIPDFIQTFITVLIMAIASFYFDYRFFVLSLISSLIFALTIPLSKKIKNLEELHIIKSEKSVNSFIISFTNRVIFKFFPGSYLFYKSYTKDLAKTVEIEGNKAKLVAAYETLAIGSNLFRELGIIVIGIFILDINVGEMFALFNITSYLNTSIASITESYIKFQKASQAFNKIEVLFNLKIEEDIDQETKIKVESIHLNDLQHYFKKDLFYPSFELSKSDILEINGKIGSGKSTFIKLISGIYSPIQGEILINQNPSNNYLRRNITSVVDQKPLLFEGTLIENISSFSENPQIDRIERLLKLTGLVKWVNTLENKIHTEIDNELVSGGQRQRLAICRALYKNPDIIIFDESTSSLDSENEELIKKIIIELADSFNKIIIIIDHKGNLAKIANKKMILKEECVEYE